MVKLESCMPFTLPEMDGFRQSPPEKYLYPPLEIAVHHVSTIPTYCCQAAFWTCATSSLHRLAPCILQLMPFPYLMDDLILSVGGRLPGTWVLRGHGSSKRWYSPFDLPVQRWVALYGTYESGGMQE